MQLEMPVSLPELENVDIEAPGPAAGVAAPPPGWDHRKELRGSVPISF